MTTRDACASKKKEGLLAFKVTPPNNNLSVGLKEVTLKRLKRNLVGEIILKNAGAVLFPTKIVQPCAFVIYVH